ncbi:hypothetical protein [Anaeromusa acidaminophila]|uniref:hypothetical protein n=1 Tax=Anaeromusa acidaminophila TaxID=81464 RepID=UPI000365BCBD|nr:hypothetical protein [Anaeromusa acidaminophila]
MKVDTSEIVILSKSFLEGLPIDMLRQLYFNVSGRTPEGLSPDILIEYISNNFYKKPVTPEMIKEQWATPQQIAQEYEVSESNVRMTCATERLSNLDKVKMGEKTWLVNRKAADQLWKKRR